MSVESGLLNMTTLLRIRRLKLLFFFWKYFAKIRFEATKNDLIHRNRSQALLQNISNACDGY